MRPSAGAPSRGEPRAGEKLASQHQLGAGIHTVCGSPGGDYRWHGGLCASCWRTSAYEYFLTAPIFTSPQDGALWGSGIPVQHALSTAAYVTHNGGRAWTPVRLPGGRVPLQTPDFVDGQHGFVIGGRLPRLGQVARDVRLYATADGGATWTARSASPLLRQASLDFVTPAVGFATLVSYGPLRSCLLETRDGGATWTSVPAGVASASTAERLRAAEAAGTLENSQARTLAEAFDFIFALRLDHQVEQLRRGEAPDDFIDPKTLNPLARSYLRSAFRAIASVQSGLATELSLGIRWG